MSIHVQLHQFQGEKERQEDSFVIVPQVPNANGLVCAIGVFDGVSATDDAHIAALHAAMGFQAALLRQKTTSTIHELMERLLRAANQAVANLRLQMAYTLTPADQRPAAVGTTAILSENRDLIIGSAGDSLALIRRGEHVVPLTKAHTDPHGAIVRHFGQEDFQPQIIKGTMQSEDELWVMTDGAYEPFAKSDPPQNPSEFFAKADEKAFWDNATAIQLTQTLTEIPVQVETSPPPVKA